jgi:transposase
MPRHPRPIRAWHLPESAPVPIGQAAALDASLDQELVRALGALPVLLPIMEHLGLREIINRHCAPAGESPTDLDPGVVTLVLVANRLLAPTPLVHVETWLAETVLPEVLGIDAAQANDDRLARTLDTLVPHLDALWQDLVVAAIRTFDLDLSQLCYDLTSISFCGTYEEADLVRYGYSRDHRPDRKQLELATTVTVEAGIPLDYRVLAGNIADRTTPVENLARLQHLLSLLPAPSPDEPTPLVISDRAMLTGEALAAYRASGLHALGPLDAHLGQGAVQRLLAGVTTQELAAAPLAYRPQRAERDPDWAPYHGVQRVLELPHPDPDQPPLVLHALVVWSPAKARLDAQLRMTELTRLEAALADLQGKLGKRPYTTRAAVEKRVATLLRRHPARPFLQVAVTGGDAEHPLALQWERGEEALAEAARLDGRYVVGTTDPTLDATRMLTLSKRRDVPEKRYALIKGPLAIRPVYLHKQERILGLVFCTMVALLVFALLELLLRRAGLGISGRTLIEQFASLSVLVLVFQDGSHLRRIAGLSPPLAHLLHTLGLPPPERYLTVHA